MNEFYEIKGMNQSTAAANNKSTISLLWEWREKSWFDWLQRAAQRNEWMKLIKCLINWMVSFPAEEAEAIKHSNSILNQFHKLAGIDGIEWIVCWWSRWPTQFHSTSSLMALNQRRQVELELVCLYWFFIFWINEWNEIDSLDCSLHWNSLNFILRDKRL